MLATPWPDPFDDDGWWFEVKWDGYRAMVSSEQGQIRIRSRRGLDLLNRFPELSGIDIPDGVVLDGEAVAFDGEGQPSFALLQEGQPVNLVIFDLLHHGEDLTHLPYEERRARLEALQLGSPILVPEATPGDGVALYDAVSKAGMEGIVGKRLGSVYRPGRRSPDWRKIATTRRVRAVVGGFLQGDGSRSSTFGSLLLGLHADDGLRWIGAVGTGFSEDALVAIHETLKELETPVSPFHQPVDLPGKKTWVTPAIVVVVEFKNWTTDNRLRAPVFKGVEVADPMSVRWEDERGV